MKKYDLIRAIVELQDLKIISPASSYEYIKKVVERTTTGTSKNFTKRSQEKEVSEINEMNKCNCGHTKPEHTKMYESDLGEGEVLGEPYDCLVVDCNCKKFASGEIDDE